MTYAVYWQDIPTMAININIKITTQTNTTTITHTATTRMDINMATTTPSTEDITTAGPDTESRITWYFPHISIDLCLQLHYN